MTRRLWSLLCDVMIGWHSGCRMRHQEAEGRWDSRYRRLHPPTYVKTRVIN